jgi:single-strand DNA-binding protein
MRVVVTQRIQLDGEWRDGETSFFKVNVWRGQAENLAESLSKGDRVMVTGRLRQRSWETPEGEKRSVTELEADEVGASLKWSTAKVERVSQRGNGDRTQGRERQAERGGDFNDQPPSSGPSSGALGSDGMWTKGGPGPPARGGSGAPPGGPWLARRPPPAAPDKRAPPGQSPC